MLNVRLFNIPTGGKPITRRYLYIEIFGDLTYRLLYIMQASVFPIPPLPPLLCSLQFVSILQDSQLVLSYFFSAGTRSCFFFPMKCYHSLAKMFFRAFRYLGIRQANKNGSKRNFKYSVLSAMTRAVNIFCFVSSFE